MKTMEILPGVVLRCYRDTRFKQGCLSLQLIRPVKEQESAMNALLPAVLLGGSRRCPDLRRITQHLDMLYGASVSPIVRRVGDYKTVGLYCGFMDDRFALPGDQVLGPMIDFMGELLLDPALENGSFLSRILDTEKKNLIATIESERNDKRVYASNQMIAHMCKGDSFGLPRLGTTEQVEAITGQQLYDYYQRVLRECPIQILYVGSAQPEEIAEKLSGLLASLDRNPMELPPQTAFDRPGGENITETMDVSQAKLCMGFTTPITNRDPEFPAMQLCNTVFGSGMTSKLFVNVREKLSLCYSVGSAYYGGKGIIAVAAGIDGENQETTKAEILRQLEDCQRGQITAQELEAARQTLLSSLRSIHDSPGAIEGYYATAALSGMAMDPETYMEKIRCVTAEDVVAAANTVKLHTQYVLKGG